MSEPAQRRRSGRRIQVRVLLLVGVGMLGPLAVMGWARWSGQQEMERQALAERSLLARFVAERAEALLSSELKELESAAEPLRTGLSEVTLARERDALRLSWVRHHALFDAVFFVDRQGAILAREPQGGAPVDGPRLLALALAAGRPAFTDLDAAGPAAPAPWAVAPVRTLEGEEVGALAGRIDPHGPHLAALFRGLHAAPGESVDLVDGLGVALASTDPARLLHEGPHAALLAGLIRERRALSRAFDGAGRDGELLAFAPLNVARWGVSVQQPQTEALEVSSTLSRSVLLLGLLLFAVALLFAWGAALSVTRPVAQLTEAAERLTAGALDTPIPLLPEDEVGRLGDALERMRLALKSSLTRVEQANAVLEQRVGERTADLERLNRELQKREQAVHTLLGKVITAQEDERRRVARELHDETTQSLAALVMRVQSALSGAPPGELRTRLEDAAALAVRTLDEVHRLIVALRPSVLDDLGLRSAILWYAQRHLEQQGIAVRCEFSGLDGRLAPQLETVVFRVVQEAMTNIGKHARAETVLIQAAVKERVLTVEIEDDGEGFDPAAVASPTREGHGWGLLGMRERVEMLGGTLQLRSARGQGTHLLLTVPLPQEA